MTSTQACLQCGRKYVPKSKVNVYCSVGCRWDASNGRRKSESAARAETGFAWPVIEPAKAHKVTVPSRKKAPTVGKWKTAVILPDQQFGYRMLMDGTFQPFHDPRAIEVAEQIVEFERPDLTVMLGDLNDMPAHGKYRQEPSFIPGTQRGLDRAAEHVATVAELSGETRVIQGNHDCLEEAAHAVTRDGPVHFSDLKPGVEVMSVDDSGLTTWERVEAVHIYDFDGTLRRYSGASLTFSVTDNHRLVGLGQGKANWTEATAAAPNSRQYAYVAGRSDVSDANRTDDEIRLAAWCLSDAYMANNRWVFYQRESKAARVRTLLTRIGLSFREAVRDRNISEICGKTLKKRPEIGYEFHLDKQHTLDEYARHRLPSWVFDLSARQVGVFLDEYRFTDGTVPTHGDSIVLYVSRRELRADVRHLLAQHGYRVSETEYRPGHWRLNIVKSPLYTLTGSNFKSVPYKGKVWCVTVPSGRFFVETHGTYFLSGNSRLENSILDNALASAGLRRARRMPGEYPVLTIPYLLGIEDMHNVKWVGGYPAGATYVNENLAAIHGRVTGNNLAEKVLNSEQVSVVMGHVHRIFDGMMTRNHHGKPKFNRAFSPGCLCRIDGAVPSMKSGVDPWLKPARSWENWQQGIAVVRYEKGDGRFAVEMVPIFEGWAHHRGEDFVSTKDVEADW